MRRVTDLFAPVALLLVLSNICGAQTPLASVPPEIGLTLEVTPVTLAPLAGSPAEKAGFQPGDVLLALDGAATGRSAGFTEAIKARPRGAVVRVTVLRGGQEQMVEATLDGFAPAPAPAEDAPATPRGRLGLPLRDELVIVQVAADGLAAARGVRRGDHLRAVNWGQVGSIDTATYRLAGARHRGHAELALDRNGERVVVQLALGEPVPYVVTPQDDAAAADHFSDLGALHEKTDAGIRDGIDPPTTLYEADFYTGVVEAIVLDSPGPGQALVTLTVPGRARSDPGIVVRWEKKELIAGWARGQKVYFKGEVRGVELRNGQARLDAFLLQGGQVFSSPGQAFNPTRPLLRSAAVSLKERVAVADVVAAVRADAARARADYQDKTMVFEGVTRRLVATGPDTYEIQFDPGTEPGVSPDSAVLRFKSDVGGALAGFKPGQTLRFRGSVRSADLDIAERENRLDGGTVRQTSARLVFDLTTLFIETTPL